MYRTGGSLAEKRKSRCIFLNQPTLHTRRLNIDHYHSVPLHDTASQQWRCCVAGQGTGDTTPRGTWATASELHDRYGPAYLLHSRHSSAGCHTDDSIYKKICSARHSMHVCPQIVTEPNWSQGSFSLTQPGKREKMPFRCTHISGEQRTNDIKKFVIV